MTQQEMPVSHDATKVKPTKTMLVAWALGECGGDREFVDKLDVAVRAFRAYPVYFGFQRYPEYPDVDAVRVQLDDMMKTKFSRMFGLDVDVPLTERGREGGTSRWRLTSVGMVWWKTNRDWLAHWIERNVQADMTAKSRTGRIKTEDEAREAILKRITGTEGFHAWHKDHSVSRRNVGIGTFFTAFGIGPRTSRPEYLEARDRILEYASSDEEITAFLRFLDQSFGEEYKRILAGEVQI